MWEKPRKDWKHCKRNSKYRVSRIELRRCKKRKEELGIQEPEARIKYSDK